MAVKKVIEIDVDVLNAQGGINGLKNSFEQAEVSTKSLKQQMMEAQKEVTQLSDKFGATSKQAIEAAKRASELKDKIGDAKALTDAFNPDAKFNSLSASLSGVASGFAAYQGALGLAGVETKDLEQQLLKVQSAMALAQGLQGLGEARDSFKQLKAVAIDAFKGIKTAIGSTGIGLFVVALGTIYAYWDDIKEAVSGVNEEQKELNKNVNDNSNKAKETLSTLNSQDETLKRNGKTEREILQIKQKQTQEAIIQQIKAIESNKQLREISEETAERNKEILKSILDFVATPIVGILGVVDAIGSKLGKTFGLEDKFKNFTSELLFDPEEIKAKGKEAAKEEQKILTELINQRDGYANQIKDIDKKAAEDSAQKAEERRKKLQEEREKELEDLKAFQAKIIEAEKEERLRLIDERFAKAENDLAWQKEIAEASAKIDEEFNQKEIDRAKNKLEQKKAIQNAELQLLDNFVGFFKEIAGKNKALQKAGIIAESALGIAKMVIANNAANAGALATPQAIATSGASAVPVIARNNISTAFGIAASIVATTKALSSLGGGSAASSGNTQGGNNGGGGSSPTFNVVGNAGVNQIASTLGKEQPPVQAYVVAGQVTTQQAMNRNIVQNATL